MEILQIPALRGTELCDFACNRVAVGAAPGIHAARVAVCVCFFLIDRGHTGNIPQFLTDP